MALNVDIINEVLHKEQLPEITELEPKQSLTADLGLDSLALAELTVRIEDEFDVDVFEESIIDTIGEIVDQVIKE